ncbi:hypothetical protein ZWY2020_053856 [Hordeum vulgare]|nr:hypothetical protein ZWY2020_053856 [Hordeum vulgare]
MPARNARRCGTRGSSSTSRTAPTRRAEHQARPGLRRAADGRIPATRHGRAIINASVKVLAIGTSGSFVGGQLNRTGFTVVVTAVVQFRVGKIPTRSTTSRPPAPVSFPAEGSSNVNMLPINCTVMTFFCG